MRCHQNIDPFFEMGAKPQPLHQSMHAAFFIRNSTQVLQDTYIEIPEATTQHLRTQQCEKIMPSESYTLETQKPLIN
jgi:hypothetical protein